MFVVIECTNTLNGRKNETVTESSKRVRYMVSSQKNYSKQFKVLDSNSIFKYWLILIASFPLESDATSQD